MHHKFGIKLKFFVKVLWCKSSFLWTFADESIEFSQRQNLYRHPGRNIYKGVCNIVRLPPLSSPPGHRATAQGQQTPHRTGHRQLRRDCWRGRICALWENSVSLTDQLFLLPLLNVVTVWRVLFRWAEGWVGRAGKPVEGRQPRIRPSGKWRVYSSSSRPPGQGGRTPLTNGKWSAALWRGGGGVVDHASAVE